ncbi:MAG: hypothetical protein ABSA21_09370 [Candidatus Limnocylindrales bacterium]
MELATEHVDGSAQLIQAEAGRAGSVYPASNGAPGDPVKPDRFVWAVTFQTVGVICPPLPGVACWTPRAMTMTVILDFHIGAFLESRTLG